MKNSITAKRLSKNIEKIPIPTNPPPNQNAIHRKNTKIKSKDIQIVHGSPRTLINNKQLKA